MSRKTLCQNQNVHADFDPTKLTDYRLLQLCQQYGAAALKARRKFEGLLPEVYRRRLYEKKKCLSIFEFAAKFAGMSEKQVRVVLNLDKRYEAMPPLREALVSGKVSVNKLARVASIATKENAEELAEKAQVLTKSALETFVRDQKFYQQQARHCHDVDGFGEGENDGKSLPGQTQAQQTLPDVNVLDVDLREHLSADVQKDLIARLKKGINIDSLLKELLQKYDEELEQEKERVGEAEIAKAEKRKQEGKKSTRYMSVKVRRVLKREYGEKCSLPHCERSAQENHHTQRFALSGNHDPRFIAPLCKAHHEIAGAIDVRTQMHKQQFTQAPAVK